MALKVSVDKKHLPKGTELEVAGLGLLKNGESTTISAEQEAEYFNRNSMTVKDGLKDSEEFKVEGTSEFKAPEPVEVSDTYNPATAEEEEKEVKE
jgi:hypothetical protein